MESRTSWVAERLDSRTGTHEVYVAARPFTAFGGDLMQRLSPDAKSLLVDAGICHYMFILRDPKGKLTMFDFGPIGGDVHVGIAAGTAADAPANQAAPSTRKAKSVQGEIRVTPLDELPQTSMLLGETNMSVNEVKQWNDTRRTMYELNVNDCRHFVNDLVVEATGQRNAAARLVRHQFLQRRSHALKPHDHIFPALQVLTNSDNWCLVQRSAHAAAAATFLRVSTPLIAAPLVSCSAAALAAVASLSIAVQRMAAVTAARVAQHKKALVSTVAAAAASKTFKEPPRTAPARLLKQVHSSHSAVAGAMVDASRALGSLTERAKSKLAQRFDSIKVLARHRLPGSRGPPLASMTACTLPKLPSAAEAAVDTSPPMASGSRLRRVVSAPRLHCAAVQPTCGLKGCGSSPQLQALCTVAQPGKGRAPCRRMLRLETRHVPELVANRR